MKEFDTEYCNVAYIDKDNVILLTWKKFACGDNYRRPTSYALELMKEHKGCKLFVDARNGFEDDKADLEWGFTVLLPAMAQTGCKIVCFIMNEVNDIEDEMDLWTKEFGKYFAVIKAADYNDALEKTGRLYLLMVRYHIKKGLRDEFYNRVKEQGVIQASKEEPGNYQYDYYIPKDSEDSLCLMEIWTSEHTQKLHGETDHFKKLTVLKQEYVLSVEIKKYWIAVE